MVIDSLLRAVPTTGGTYYGRYILQVILRAALRAVLLARSAALGTVLRAHCGRCYGVAGGYLGAAYGRCTVEASAVASYIFVLTFLYVRSIEPNRGPKYRVR